MTNLLETSAARKAGATPGEKLARIGKLVPASTAVTVGTIIIFAIAVAIISAFGVKRNEIDMPVQAPSQSSSPADSSSN